MTDTTPTAQLSDLNAIRSFVLGGNALFTLVSKHTGERRTFKVEKGEPNERYPKPGYFVRMLCGPDNENDYRYVGFLFHTADGRLRLKTKGEGDARAAVFRWFLEMLNVGGLGRFLEQAEFWHAGRCCRCGRTLTTPESIASGIGPVCASM
jgi:hypothetical protein